MSSFEKSTSESFEESLIDAAGTGATAGLTRAVIGSDRSLEGAVVGTFAGAVGGVVGRIVGTALEDVAKEKLGVEDFGKKAGTVASVIAGTIFANLAVNSTKSKKKHS